MTNSCVNLQAHLRRAASATVLLACVSTISSVAFANSLDQAKRMHDRLTGIPADADTLGQMANFIDNGQTREAANLAMDNPAFYNITLKHWITPWTNRDGDVFQPLNDYTATVIGLIRDNQDFRQILSGDVLYTGDVSRGIVPYSPNNNDHYSEFEARGLSLKDDLIANSQSSLLGIPPDATAGIMTTRAAAKAFFIDGTNRAMFRFTLINHLCMDLEAVKDITRSPDRIRQDVSRSPGGDSRLFTNSCIGCHSGMDPLAQAFAYYNYEYDVNSDPNAERGRLIYNNAGVVDAVTGTRVHKKYWNNNTTFPHGYITTDDAWINYWRNGQNANLGWSTSLSGQGKGAKTMGEELANSRAFAQCQVTKVFENVCLRKPQDTDDRAQINAMLADFQTDYLIKPMFADAANYCKGD